jgi:PAS domain S-box-containing protein
MAEYPCQYTANRNCIRPPGKDCICQCPLFETTGWKAHDIIGQDWFDLFIPENVREEIRKVFITVMSQQDTLGFSTYENQIVTKSGDLQDVAWSNVLTKDAQGNILDVT